MTKTDIQKELYKSKVDATFDRFENGKLYYNVEVQGWVYQFPIDTLKTVDIVRLIHDSIDGEMTLIDEEIDQNVVPADDISGAAFTAVMPARLLNRWIGKAVDTENFIKRGL